MLCVAGCTMECEECLLAMRRVPGTNFNYSDHEGVAATFILNKNVTGQCFPSFNPSPPSPHSVLQAGLFTALPPPRETGEIEKHLTDALPIIDNAMKRVRSDQVYYVVAMALLGIALTFTFDLSLPYGLTFLILLLRGLLVVALAFCFWTASVLSNKELNGLIAARKDINNALKSNPPL